MRTFITKLYVGLSFLGFYVFEILVSNLRLAKDVLAVRPKLTPGIVAMPVDNLTDRQILALSILLTMTPGTLSLEVNIKKRVIYLHVLYLEQNVDEWVETTRQQYEPSIRALF